MSLTLVTIDGESFQYIQLPVCLVSPDCFNTELLETQVLQQIKYGEGVELECNELTVYFTDTTHFDDDQSDDFHDQDDDEHGDFFYIKSAFPSDQKWCIKPEDNG